MNVADEIKGVMINGKEHRGIEPTGGWGSGVRIQIDNYTGKIDYAERQETPQDTIYKNLYLNFLKKQFDEIEQNEKDE